MHTNVEVGWSNQSKKPDRVKEAPPFIDPQAERGLSRPLTREVIEFGIAAAHLSEHRR